MTERERFLKLCEDFDALETRREEALGREDNPTAARLLRQSDKVYKKIQSSPYLSVWTRLVQL